MLFNCIHFAFRLFLKTQGDLFEVLLEAEVDGEGIF
jgi:hypothetical protein